MIQRAIILGGPDLIRRALWKQRYSSVYVEDHFMRMSMEEVTWQGPEEGKAWGCRDYFWPIANKETRILVLEWQGTEWALKRTLSSEWNCNQLTFWFLHDKLWAGGPGNSCPDSWLTKSVNQVDKLCCFKLRNFWKVVNAEI